MFAGSPGTDQIVGNSLTATGTLVTVPAGNILTANVSLTGFINVAGNCNPTVSISGAGGGPANGAVIHRLALTGVALTSLGDSLDKEIIVRAPAGNSIDVVFTAGASGTSSATISGWITT